MKKTGLLVMISVIILTACHSPKSNRDEVPLSPVSELAVRNVIQKMLDKYGAVQKFRIEKGVKQVASLWRNQDGSISDFEKFCMENFEGTDKGLDILFEKISKNFEILNGYNNRISLDLKSARDVEIGDYTPIDEIFGAYEPTAHLGDDFFANKIAFIIALNFPAYSLKEKTELGPDWTRKQWAFARVGDMYTSRVPADVIQLVAQAFSNAENYIAGYNIYMGNLVNEKGDTFFPKKMKLISHWGLRDELKSHYADKGPEGLMKQKMIYEVMKRIITQEIPDSVINNPGFLWDPYANKLYKNKQEVKFNSEPDCRYSIFLENFHAVQQVDKYSPMAPTFIQRQFEQGMEIPQPDVEKLFIQFVSSPQVKQVAALISKRLGRNLEPFDIWYDGFKARSSMPESSLTAITSKKYPDVAAFEKDMANILGKLGFSPEKASFISSKVAVDPARGSGHAWGASMKDDKSHLRTRIAKDGMDYKGYNIAVHEFGHNVEQTISLHDVDYYMLAGVPNTAFTEATAFVFQSRDLDLLGIKNDNADLKYLQALDNFWMAYEIMGVSLVDMETWKWLYANPQATSAQLKETVLRISKEVWNKYYADVFGVKDQVILGIYSHMINSPLYLSAYPVGHLIEFQVEKQIAGKNFASEIERMYSYGKIIPQIWMKNAVGSEISIKPVLEAVDVALTKIK